MTSYTITDKYSNGYSVAIRTDARPQSKAFANAVAEYEKANGYEVGTFSYYISYDRYLAYPTAFKRNFKTK